uniref:DAO domain-containing protein n=1 Tax=Heterorhabditis bacteriophora TaxID=37862 RepID=A0A1I7XTV7_HETBA
MTYTIRSSRDFSCKLRNDRRRTLTVVQDGNLLSAANSILFLTLLFSSSFKSPSESHSLEVTGTDRNYFPVRLHSISRSGFFYTTLYLQPTTYLDYITKKFIRAGGRLVQGLLKDISDVGNECNVIVNCTGLGSNQLLGDEKVRPIRGQIIRVRCPAVKHFFADDDNYVLLNDDCLILGGTAELNKWDRTVNEKTAQRILEDNIKNVPALKVVPVVNNYGHGGSGITLFWGCALDVVKLVQKELSSNSSAAKFAFTFDMAIYYLSVNTHFYDMFPAYSSTHQSSGENKNGDSQESDNNSDPFSSFSQKKILEKRKKRAEISKENKRIEHLKSLMTYNYIRSSESEEEACTVSLITSYCILSLLFWYYISLTKRFFIFREDSSSCSSDSDSSCCSRNRKKKKVGIIVRSPLRGHVRVTTRTQSDIVLAVVLVIHHKNIIPKGLNNRDVENTFERRTPMYRKEMSFVPLSQEPWRPFEFKDVCPSEVVDLELRRRIINIQLSKEPKNVDLYLKFLELEDEIFERNRERGIQNSDHNALRERKLAIVDVAIKNNPRDPELRIRKIDIMKDSNDLDDLVAQWDKLLNVFVNSCDIWEKYLDAIQYDSKMYSFSRMEKAFDRCIDKLGNILKGIIRSHTPEEGTASFLLSVYIRRLRWWIESGYTSRAVASIQACLHNNILRLTFLRCSWYNCIILCYRIGESMSDNVTLWVEMERALDDIECRPRRCEQEDSVHDIKPVSFDDLRIFIAKDNSFIYPLLVTMGARLIFHDSPWVNIVDLVEEWDLPRLNGRSPPLSVLKIVERIITFMLSLSPSIEFVAAVLATHASFVDNLIYMPPKTRICAICAVGKQLAEDHRDSLGDGYLDMIISVFTLKLSMKWMNVSKAGRREQLKKIRRVKQLISSQNSGIYVCDFSPLQIQLLLSLLLLEIQLVPAEDVLRVLTQFVLRTTSENEVRVLIIFKYFNMHVLSINCFNLFYFSLKQTHSLLLNTGNCSESTLLIFITGFLRYLNHQIFCVLRPGFTLNMPEAHKSVLIEVLRAGCERFPYDCSLLRRYIDARSDFVKMRIELANVKTTHDNMINARNSLACMYLEWKNYQKRLASANICDSKEMGSRIMLATYRREAQRRKDPLLWRMAMSQEWNKKRIDEKGYAVNVEDVRDLKGEETTLRMVSS